MPEKIKRVLTLFLEPFIDEKLQIYCKSEDRSMAWVVNKLLAEKFGSGEKMYLKQLLHLSRHHPQKI